MSANIAQGQDVANVNQESPQRNIRPKYHPLTVPIVAHYLSKGHSPPQIARIMGCSDVAVYRYIQRHTTDLELLKDNDILLAKKIDYMNHKLVDSITDKQIKEEKPKDKFIMLGIGVEKSLLLKGQLMPDLNINIISLSNQELIRACMTKINPQKVGDNSDNQAQSEVIEVNATPLLECVDSNTVNTLHNIDDKDK